MNNTTHYNRFLQICLMLLITLSATSCFDDTDMEVVDIIRPDPKEIVDANIHGIVIDHEGNRATDAIVQLLTESGQIEQQIENDNGSFLFVNSRVPRSAYIKVVKNGQTLVRRRIDIIENQVNYVELHLPEIKETFEFNGNQNASIGSGRMGIYVPADALQTVNGVPYTGRVMGQTYETLPTDADFHNKIMGDLGGINKQGEEVALTSFGMISISLNTDTGEKLELKPESTIQLFVPIGLENSIAEVPMWKLNEQSGEWSEQGVASQIYEPASQTFGFNAAISSLGVWNFDTYTDPIDISGQVKISHNGMLSQNITGHYEIFISNPDLGKRGGFLTSDGRFLFTTFPKGEPFSISIYDNCDNLIFDALQGPFDADIKLNDIEININRAQTILSGKLQDCTDQDIKEGLIIVETEDKGVFVNQFIDGNFSISFDKACVSDDELLIYFMNRSTENISLPYHVYIDQNNLDIGTITLCPQTQTYLQYTLDNQPHVMCSSPLVNLQTAPIYSTMGCGEFFISILDLNKEGVFREDVDIALTYESVQFVHADPQNFTVYIDRFGANVNDQIDGTIIGEVRPALGGGLYGDPVRITGSFKMINE